MVDAGVFFIPRISRVLLLTRLILIFNSTSCASLLSASSLLFLSLSLSLSLLFLSLSLSLSSFYVLHGFVNISASCESADDPHINRH